MLRGEPGASGNATTTAIAYLHRHGLYVVGGLIVGNPEDTRESIEANLAFARRWVDYPYIQHPTPYPRTPMNEELRARRLIANDDVTTYATAQRALRGEYAWLETGVVGNLKRQ